MLDDNRQMNGCSFMSSHRAVPDSNSTLLSVHWLTVGIGQRRRLGPMTLGRLTFRILKVIESLYFRTVIKWPDPDCRGHELNVRWS